MKETMFFDRHYRKGVRWYSRHFAHCESDQLCGEIAPTYFDVECVPSRIHQLNPACKIIVSLRNPVDRAWSLYRHHLGRGFTRKNLAEAIVQYPRIVDAGLYSRHIPRWLDIFGTTQVTFVFLEDIASNPEAVLGSIYEFLAVEAMPMPSKGYKKFSLASAPRFPWLAKWVTWVAVWLRGERLHEIVELGKAMGFRKIYTGGKDVSPLSPNDRQRLLEIYEQDVEFVENLLGRDLSSWRQIT